MASNSGWTTGLPSGQSKVSNTDEEFRSFKSYMEEWWEQEHYATDGSTTSAGVHKEGSGRIYSQAGQPTAIAPDGQVWHDPDDDNLYVYNGSAWTFIASGSLRTTTANQWSGTQGFSTLTASYLSASGVSTSVATVGTLVTDSLTPSSISASVVTQARLARVGVFTDILLGSVNTYFTLAGYAATGQEVTVTGAAVNDHVFVGQGSNKATDNIVVSGYVTNTNVVTLRWSNATSAAYDPVSATTFSIFVVKPV